MGAEHIYKATAANTYFWQTLAVRAASREEAYQAFRAYLLAPEQQASEKYEYDNGQQIKDVVSEPCDRAQYVYSVDWQAVESLSDWKDEFGDRVPSGEVVMLDSGGNG